MPAALRHANLPAGSAHFLFPAVKETSPVRPIAEDPDAALDAWRDQRATEYEAEQSYNEQQTKEGK